MRLISISRDYWIAAFLSIIYLAFAYLGPIPTTHAEVFGFISGALAVWFVARNKMINWPIGIINAVFFVYLFYQYKLYADMTINMWYVIAGAWGWWMWSHGGPNRAERPISDVPKREFLWTLVAFTVCVYIVHEILLLANGAAPWLDAITASLSIAAFYLQGRRYIQSWYLWILADIVYIPLYYSRDLYMTAILYVAFMIMCFIGLLHWRKQFKKDLNQKEQYFEYKPALR